MALEPSPGPRPGWRPPARTFKPRRRSLSPERAVAHGESMQRWGVAPHGPQLDLPTVFGCDGPFVLDIGFGGGEALVEVAAERPDECVLGVEVHTTGLASVLAAVERLGLRNVRVCDGDAFDLAQRLMPGSLDAIRIFFPDPWPKQKQRHRRLVRADVVAELTALLRPGGELHLATDVAGYAEQMQAVCGADPGLSGGIVPRPEWRPTTRYERRGVAEGRTAVDLVYGRR